MMNDPESQDAVVELAPIETPVTVNSDTEQED